MRSIVLALAVASVLALPIAAQDAPKAPPAPPPPMPAMEGHAHPMGPGARSHDHQMMMARMDSMEARLATLVTEMNAASGSKKTNATAAALTQLVANHTAMRSHMHQMMMAGPMAAGMGGMACGPDGGCCKDGCCCKPGASMSCAPDKPPEK